MQPIVDGVQGFMYPNEVELQWSILISLPVHYRPGRRRIHFGVAGARFPRRSVKPTYGCAPHGLAFLLVAPLPLQLHLGHPNALMRCTPRPPDSPWRCSDSSTCGTDGGAGDRNLAGLPPGHRAPGRLHGGPLRWLYKAMTLGSTNLSPRRCGLTTAPATSSR